MFITAVCFIFLIKLRWPKTKSLYEVILLEAKKRHLKHASRPNSSTEL